MFCSVRLTQGSSNRLCGVNINCLSIEIFMGFSNEPVSPGSPRSPIFILTARLMRLNGDVSSQMTGCFL